MAEDLFTSNREFVVLSFERGHGQLILASKKTVSCPTRITILFKVVDAMRFRPVFKNLSIHAEDLKVSDSIPTNPDTRISGFPLNLYHLVSTGFKGYVAAALMFVIEDEADDLHAPLRQKGSRELGRHFAEMPPLVYRDLQIDRFQTDSPIFASDRMFSIANYRLTETGERFIHMQSLKRGQDQMRLDVVFTHVEFLEARNFFVGISIFDKGPVEASEDLSVARDLASGSRIYQLIGEGWEGSVVGRFAGFEETDRKGSLPVDMLTSRGLKVYDIFSDSMV